MKNNQTQSKRGGSRQGAGRKPGVPNKVTAKREAEIASSGLTPLDFMLSVLRDESRELADRLYAAKNAAPYCHPKRVPVDGDGQEAGLTLNIYTGVPRDDTDD